MRKAASAALAILLLLGLLAGCQPHRQLFSGSPTPEPTGTAAPTAEPAVAPTEGKVSLEPVPEDVFYFSNQLEDSRLYRQRADGTGLELAIDREVSSVSVADGWVYFLYDQQACRLNPASGEVQVLFATDSFFLSASSDYAYYIEYDAERDPSSALCAFDLASRQSVTLPTVGAWDLPFVTTAGGVDRVYNLEYRIDGDEYSTHLVRYDMSTGERAEITASTEGDAFGLSYLRGFGDCVTYQKDGKLHCLSDSTGETTVVSDENFLVGPLLWTDGSAFVAADAYGDCYNLLLYADGKTEYIPLEGPRYLTFDAERGGKMLLHTIQANEVSPSEWTYRVAYGVFDPAVPSLLDITAPGECGKLFAGGDFPQIDTSTSRLPLTQALYSLLVTNYGYAGDAPISSKTHGAWLAIADKTADIALLCAPTEEEEAYLAGKGVQVEMTRYGAEALAFLVNAENPVTGLTQQQYKDIYTGKITNWKQVGGPDHAIAVYYRNDQSGSQRTFETFLFPDGDLPDYEALGFLRSDEMSDIVDMIAYDEHAVGYSVLTYVTGVYKNESVKILDVDGVSPSVANIADEVYPFQIPEFLVLRSDEAENSPARRLVQWFADSRIARDLLARFGVSGERPTDTSDEADRPATC